MMSPRQRAQPCLSACPTAIFALAFPAAIFLDDREGLEMLIRIRRALFC